VTIFLDKSQSWLNLYHLAAKAEGKCTWTDKTVTQQVSFFLLFMDSLGRPTLNDVTPHDCLAWLATLHSRTPPLEMSTISAYYQCVHAFFEWAVREKLIEESPLKYVKPPKVKATPDKWRVDTSGKVCIKRFRS
jgi:site-specific recombinase XerD